MLFRSPGTPIGTPFNLGNMAPVGAKNNTNPTSPLGNQVGSGIGGISKVASQDFSNINPNQLAAPLPNYTGIGAAPTFWDRTKQKVLSVVNYFNPNPLPPTPKANWVPGISRRNRERAEERRMMRD